VRAGDNVLLLVAAKLPAPDVVVGTNVWFLRSST